MMGQNIYGKKILNIGCLTGELLRIFKEKGAEFYELELKKKAVIIANESLPSCAFQADLR